MVLHLSFNNKPLHNSVPYTRTFVHQPGCDVRPCTIYISSDCKSMRSDHQPSIIRLTPKTSKQPLPAMHTQYQLAQVSDILSRHISQGSFAFDAVYLRHLSHLRLSVVLTKTLTPSKPAKTKILQCEVSVLRLFLLYYV